MAQWHAHLMYVVESWYDQSNQWRQDGPPRLEYMWTDSATVPSDAEVCLYYDGSHPGIRAWGTSLDEAARITAKAIEEFPGIPFGVGVFPSGIGYHDGLRGRVVKLSDFRKALREKTAAMAG